MSELRNRIAAAVVDGYFERLNAHDLDGVMAGIAESCEMRIPNSGFTYSGKAAIRTHLADFMETFETVHFRNYHTSADPVTRTVGIHFDVNLRAHDGEVVDMNNANFFELDETLQLTDILIFASAPLSRGFEAGSG